jgi:hypothetical protein
MRRTTVAKAAVCLLTVAALTACRPLADKNTTPPSAGATRPPAGNKYPNTSKPDVPLPTRTHVPCLEGWTPSIQRNTCQKESDVDGCLFLDLTNAGPDDEYRFFCYPKQGWVPITNRNQLKGTGVDFGQIDLTSLCYGRGEGDRFELVCGDGFRHEN